MSVLVRFTETKTEQQTSFGPFHEVQLLINEIWVVTAEDAFTLAEYDTEEGYWHVFDHRVDDRRFYLVTITTHVR